MEIWEDAITYPLKKAGVVSQSSAIIPTSSRPAARIITSDFTAWDYQPRARRGCLENQGRSSWAGSPHFGMKRDMPYASRAAISKARRISPARAPWPPPARWLDDNAGAHDRFFLFVDEFDPHEPFDTPDEYVRRYDPDWDGPPLIWPPYAVGAVKRGIMSEREGRQIRARYGAKLTMIDHWLGKVLDRIDEKKLWDDTLVILCTDHGHYLGEKDIWGKRACRSTRRSAISR